MTADPNAAVGDDSAIGHDMTNSTTNSAPTATKAAAAAAATASAGRRGGGEAGASLDAGSDTPAHAPSSRTASSSWRLTGTGQLVGDAGEHWDIADEILEMQAQHSSLSQSKIMNQIPSTARDSPRPVPQPTALNGHALMQDTSTNSSDASSSSPDDSRQISLHSRDSSASTLSSSSSAAKTPVHNRLLSHAAPKAVKAAASADKLASSRPHSFSGDMSISDVDLRRLEAIHISKPADSERTTDIRGDSPPRPDDDPARRTMPAFGAGAPASSVPFPQQHPASRQVQPAPAAHQPYGNNDFKYPRQHLEQAQGARLLSALSPNGADQRAAGAQAAALYGNAAVDAMQNNLQQSAYRQPHRQTVSASFALPPQLGLPMSMQMPLAPPLTNPNPQWAPFAAQLSATHPPMYDFAALQQQQLQQQQLQHQQLAALEAQNSPLSPPSTVTPGISPQSARNAMYRPAHHHSVSDPATLRDAAALSLLGSGLQAQAMQSLSAGMLPQVFPPQLPFGMQMPPGAMYPGAGGFYPSPTEGQQAYTQDLLNMMARSLPQYAVAAAAVAQAAAAQAAANGAPYPLDMSAAGLSAANMGGLGSGGAFSAGSDAHSAGPSANNRKLGLYKTELCRSWEEKGTCRYGPKCQFAHGEDEIRRVSRHPKYKTEICRTFWVSGSCPYGKRCCFIHTELPSGGPGAGGTGSSPGESTTPTNGTEAQARGTSTANSDNGDQAQTSLLARISVKRADEPGLESAVSSLPSFQFGRPANGSLRVDTSTIDNASSSMKQNKSAFPTFAATQTLAAATSDPNNRSSPPATAGPEFGRQRLEVLGVGKPNGVGHIRSYSGTESTLAVHHAPMRSLSGHLTPLSAAPDNKSNSSTPAPTHGHSRSSSGSHWGTARVPPAAPAQQQHLTAMSAYPHSTDITSPWTAHELRANPNASFNDRTWS